MRMKSIEECYKDLASAVVKQCAEDYRDILKWLWKHRNTPEDNPRRIAAVGKKKYLENWFHGPVYALYCSLDPEIIIRGIQREVNEWIEKKEREVNRNEDSREGIP